MVTYTLLEEHDEQRAAPLLQRAESRFHMLPSGPAPASGQPQHDVVLVMPAPGCGVEPSKTADQERRRRLLAAKAKAVGLEAIAVVSRDEDEILLQLSATDELLERVAESTRLAKRLSKAHGGGYRPCGSHYLSSRVHQWKSRH